MRLEGFADVSVVLQAGVYALVKNGVVIYVGKSKSLYQRIYTHRNVARNAARGAKIPTWMPIKGFVFDQVFVQPCSLAALDALEREMIERYKPRYNQSLKSARKIDVPLSVTINGIVLSMNSPPPAPMERRL